MNKERGLLWLGKDPTWVKWLHLCLFVCFLVWIFKVESDQFHSALFVHSAYRLFDLFQGCFVSWVGLLTSMVTEELVAWLLRCCMGLGRTHAFWRRFESIDRYFLFDLKSLLDVKFWHISKHSPYSLPYERPVCYPARKFDIQEATLLESLK